MFFWDVYRYIIYLCIETLSICWTSMSFFQTSLALLSFWNLYISSPRISRPPGDVHGQRKRQRQVIRAWTLLGPAKQGTESQSPGSRWCWPPTKISWVSVWPWTPERHSDQTPETPQGGIGMDVYSRVSTRPEKGSRWRWQRNYVKFDGWKFQGMEANFRRDDQAYFLMCDSENLFPLCSYPPWK